MGVQQGRTHAHFSAHQWDSFFRHCSEHCSSFPTASSVVSQQLYPPPKLNNNNLKKLKKIITALTDTTPGIKDGHLSGLKASFFSHKLQEGAELILKADGDCLKVHVRTKSLNKPVLIALHLFKSHMVVHFGEKLALLFS